MGHKKINFQTILLSAIACFGLSDTIHSQEQFSEKPEFIYSFDNPITEYPKKDNYTRGVEGNSLVVDKGNTFSLDLKNKVKLDYEHDFSVQFWINTTISPDKKTVILSDKDFSDISLSSQKNPGWAFYLSGGTWAWNLGSGKRRITYERDNGNMMAINDGNWHLLNLTYNAQKAEVRLYFDGVNRAIYHVSDSKGFPFKGKAHVTIGTPKRTTKIKIASEIIEGQAKLQRLINACNEVCSALKVPEVQSNEFIDLVVDPYKLLEIKTGKKIETATYPALKEISLELMKNPYTVHQVKDFMTVSQLAAIYTLKKGKVIINGKAANKATKNIKLTPAAFRIGGLTMWQHTITAKEIADTYNKIHPLVAHEQKTSLKNLNAAVWNIHHGGKHNTMEKDGWDSRKRIAEMLKNKNADVIMMQETYSSGDYIAAELGYYFATTVDWDYLNQGSNVSVLSKFPIEEVYVPEEASFMNVACKIKLSKTQHIYVMSNWYGMNSFLKVFDFHKTRFNKANTIPVLFGGDFNAIPAGDGGESLAAETLLEYGFTDAYRHLYPDTVKYPGYTFQDGIRIDQLYYLGQSLKNTEVNIISDWPTGFPSDHYMIFSSFELQ